MTPMLAKFSLIGALALGCGLAAAQGASAPTPGMGAGPMGPGKGMGGGPMHGWRMTHDNTPGWSLMTAAERQAHHDKMMSMTDHAACTAYMAQHQAQMAERAKQRGGAAPARPRHDACAPLARKP